MRALTGDASPDNDRLREIEDAVAAVDIRRQRIPVAVIAKRAGTPDEVAVVAALLMGSDGGFITGSDFLMDGGVTASYWYGEVAEVREQ
jgi:NAD(P)-dependent dehydrogenase (short-subunit alcohol dehydrogenase family)